MALNKYIYGAEVLYSIDPRNLDEAVKKKADELQRGGYDLNTWRQCDCNMACRGFRRIWQGSS